MTMSDIQRIFRDPPKLHTARLTLRKIKRSDAADMYEYSCDPELTRYLLWDPHDDLRFTERYVDYLNERYRDGEYYDWGVELTSERKLIGTAGFTKFDAQNNCAEVGYVISRAYWGRGIAPEALEAVVRFGFIELNLHRIEARYMAGNERSRRVMEKCGMTYEGTRREALYVRGAYKDVGMCSLLFSDWVAKNASARAGASADKRTASADTL